MFAKLNKYNIFGTILGKFKEIKDRNVYNVCLVGPSQENGLKILTPIE